jgi:hypothetical protein
MTAAAKRTGHPSLPFWQALMLRSIARLLIWIVKTLRL